MCDGYVYFICETGEPTDLSVCGGSWNQALVDIEGYLYLKTHLRLLYL
jgi:hypothetical protein